ncbi:MAG: hypothetical protein KBG00_10700 [Rhodoferax sp.]|uniref:hypothetical protein n=1 Tax=Rhodoferax sp. TaxID=50421 RepID=UPI001B4D391F|nr:hypothetical protein [Rhodoferax sp.]MBP9149238.1 hypothetical protein [Rhodoferax sp.]MBP9736189.1 hypothetical protein [Rhodoferax sp.]
MDIAAHRQRMLRHCLWLANQDPAYAKWAAKQYEQQSDGVLEGLHARVVQTIEKRNKQLDQPPPTKET